MKKLIFVLCLALALCCAACGPTFVPKATLDKVDQNLTLSLVVQNPDANKGKSVLWGGKIIKTINKEKGSLIEVVQLPLDATGRPEDSDKTQGRFIIAIKQFMDPSIYDKDREISVAGEVVGVETLPLGDTKYTYALLRADDVKLWPKRPVNINLNTPPYPYMMGPPNMYWYNAPYLWW